MSDLNVTINLNPNAQILPWSYSPKDVNPKKYENLSVWPIDHRRVWDEIKIESYTLSTQILKIILKFCVCSHMSQQGIGSRTSTQYAPVYLSPYNFFGALILIQSSLSSFEEKMGRNCCDNHQSMVKFPSPIIFWSWEWKTPINYFT